MKLKELKNRFNFNHLTKEEKAKLQQQKEEANFEFLRKHLSVIFPLAGKLEKGDLHIIQEVNDFLSCLHDTANHLQDVTDLEDYKQKTRHNSLKRVFNNRF